MINTDAAEFILADDLQNVDEGDETSDFHLRCEWQFKDREAAIDRLRQLWLHRAPNPSHMNIRLLLLAEALAPNKGDSWTCYSRDSTRYSLIKRYCGSDCKYEPLIAEMEKLPSTQKGLLEHIKQPPQSHRNAVPRQSMFRATEKLRMLMGDLEIEFVVREVIHLRGMFSILNDKMYDHKEVWCKYYSKLIQYVDDCHTEKFRAEIERINDFMRTIKLEWKAVVTNNSSKYYHFNDDGVLTTPLFITRSFCRNSFDLYGRVHGFWQNQRKGLRADIRLNDMETCEPDYSQCHVNIAYLEKGLIPPERAYLIDGLDEKLIERVVPIIFNASNVKGAIGAVATKLRKDNPSLKFEDSESEASSIIDLVKAKHNEIAEYFHDDRGIKLMRIESDIAVQVMLTCVEEHIPFLPIHDGFRVPLCHGDRMKDIMIHCFQQRYPGFLCRVKL